MKKGLYMLARAVGYQHQLSARIQRSERMGVRFRTWDPEDDSVEARGLLLPRQCGNKKVVVFFSCNNNEKNCKKYPVGPPD
jgi:phage protein U